MNKRAILYARVSTQGQKDNTSLPNQIAQMEKHCQETGYQIVERIEVAHSGRKADLPGIQRLLQLGRDDKADIVIVYRLDRFMRGNDADSDPGIDAAITERQLNKVGLEVEYLDLPDKGSEAYVWIKAIKRIVASVESKNIAERMTTGRRRIAEGGQVMTHGHAPYGYRLDKSNGKRQLVIHEPEAQVVREIFMLYTDEAVSAYAIAQRLSDWQEPSWYDINGMGEKRAGYGQWSGQMVTRILKKELYAGTWYYGKKNRYTGEVNPKENLIAVTVPAIVDPDTWRKAQARMEHNKDWPNQTERPYLVQGHAKCGLCGRPIHTYFCRYKSKKTGEVTEHRYYVCSSYRKKEYKCELPYFKQAEVDNAIWDVIWKLQSDPEYLRERLTKLVDDWYTQTQGARERLATIDSMIEDHDRQLSKLLDLYLADDFPKEMLVERKERLEKTLAGLQAERQKLAQVLQEPSWLIQTIQANTDPALDGLAQVLSHMSSGKPLTIEGSDGQSKRFKYRFETDFQDKRAMIERIETDVTLTVGQDGQKEIYFSCILGEEVIQLLDTTSRNGRVG